MATVKNKSKKVKPKDAGTYIDPRTDFGFKRLFGDKELMMGFLNAVLDVKEKIVDLHYKNTVRTGAAKGDRSAIFDLLALCAAHVYCTTGKGEHIIVEMQKLPQTYYAERSLYYASFKIQEQGEKRKTWNFDLRSVYSVNVLNFKFDEEKETDKYTSRIKLMDEDTKEVFSEKLLFVFLELPRFTKTIDELENSFEHWMLALREAQVYALKHIHEMDDIPATLLKNRIFKRLFACTGRSTRELAEVANMTKQEINAYNRSLKNFKDTAYFVRSTSMNMARMEIGMAKRELREKEKRFEAERKAHQKTIAVVAQKDNALAQKDNIIAEYKRIYGNLPGLN